MAGRERSPRHRPWSVYRANTFDLSNEMMGLALTGKKLLPLFGMKVLCYVTVLYL